MRGWEPTDARWDGSVVRQGREVDAVQVGMHVGQAALLLLWWSREVRQGRQWWRRITMLRGLGWDGGH